MKLDQPIMWLVTSLLILLEKSLKLLTLGNSPPQVSINLPNHLLHQPTQSPPSAGLDSPLLSHPLTVSLFIEHILCAAIALGTGGVAANETVFPLKGLTVSLG